MPRAYRIEHDLGRLLASLGPQLKRYVYGFCGHSADAEDIAQEVLARPSSQSPTRCSPAMRLRDLPEIYRTIGLLRDLNGLSTAEAAEALEISTHAVKTRLHRPHMQLRLKLQAYRGGRTPDPVRPNFCAKK